MTSVNAIDGGGGGSERIVTFIKRVCEHAGLIPSKKDHTLKDTVVCRALQY